ncbi:MAG: hypothetical protein LBB88_01650, partial [Planctomycetaceae bacterium]|nr:hypothetical protein [Planctomycetaceae bacterium]
MPSSSPPPPPPFLSKSKMESGNKSNPVVEALSQRHIKSQPPPAPNKKHGDLTPEEIAILLPPEDDEIEKSNKVATVSKQSLPLKQPPILNIAAITEEAKAEKEHQQNSLLVKSIVEQKRKKERKTLIVTIISSVVGA